MEINEILAEERKNRCFSDQELHKWTFENDDRKNPELTKIAKNYADAFPEMLKLGKGLLFFGKVGTGKSFLSACIANKLMDEGYPCLMTDFARIGAKLFAATNKQKEIDKFKKYSLLIIDDFGAERNTEYMTEIMFSVIDSRLKSKMPLIITTNLTAEEIKHSDDIRRERLLSRLRQICLPFEVKGGDRRNQKLRQDYNNLIETLTR